MIHRLLLLCVLLSSAPAIAGTLQVKDEAHVLAAGDVDALRQRAAEWPFDARVLVSSAPSKSAFEGRAAGAVSSPRMVVIGVDPAHRFTVVRFGVAVGIASEEWPVIASAGNAAFKQGLWGAGIAAIGQHAAERSSRAPIAVPAPPAPQQVTTTTERVIRAQPAADDSDSFAVVVLLVLLGSFAFAGLLLWLSMRRRQRADEEQRLHAKVAADLFATTGAAPPRSPRPRVNTPEPAPRPAYAPAPPTPSPGPRTVAPPPVIVQQPAPVVVQSAPAFVHHHHDGGSDLLTGVLVGQALGHHHHEPERVREREVVRETRVETRRDPTPVRSYDSGGSSSSWSSSDSGGSSSSWSSSDSGGGSSSWDSGSSGGGSSDW